MTERQRLHELVEKLPAVNLTAAEQVLESLSEHPVERSLRLAPVSDEPLSAADQAALRAAREDKRPARPLEELLDEFGLR